MLFDWWSQIVDAVAKTVGLAEYELLAIVVVILVSIICGSVGSLVVGNRMAFFSDALAHCAFAGVALGMLSSIALRSTALESWLLPVVMVAFGVAVGLAIAFVREKTGLASDTVIGVFFAGAVGFGGMLYTSLQRNSNINPESFLFGSPLFVSAGDVLALIALGVLLAIVLTLMYNHLVLVSFNPSLARSRGVPVRLCNYLFVILLALIVNLCLRAVGALLINAMLVVPAATAANLSRNLRQLFWLSVLLSLAAGLAGLWLSSLVRIPIRRGEFIEFGPAGTIVVVSVALFFASIIWKSFADRCGGSLALNSATRENEAKVHRPSAQA